MNFWPLGLPIPTLDESLWNDNQHEEKLVNHLLIQKTLNGLLPPGKHHAGYCSILASRMLIILQSIKAAHLRDKLRLRGDLKLVVRLICDVCHPIAREGWFDCPGWLEFSFFPTFQGASLPKLGSSLKVWPFHRGAAVLWSNIKVAALLFLRPQFSSVHSLSRVWLRLHELQHAGPPRPSPTPGATQTHVHRVGDAIQPSHPLSSPSPPAFYLSQHQDLFKWVSSSHQVAKVLEFQLQHQSFLLDWLVWPACSPRDSEESSPTPQFKSINSLALSFLHSPTLTSIHDHWKNHSFD